jgi:hypothetical protein
LTISIPLFDFDPVKGEDGDIWAYHTSYEIDQNLSSLAKNFTTICEYTTAQELLGTRNITGNRTIPILFIGNRSDENRKWIMLIGAHHGDEPDSAETVLAFAHHMLPNIEQGAYLERLVNSVNIALLPVVNPYGLDMGTRFDENNEDPNRDYPFVPEGSTLYSDGIPLSTAGAHAVHSLAKLYPFSIALSFHTGSKGIYTPWGAEGIGSNTPDMNMFHDLGAVLSRASGKGLIHGPANGFGGLGYLRGAFDDHLYGASFYSQHLSSPAQILPWSTATATVELVDEWGMNVERLGNLNGVNDPSGPDDGTLPMGIRMSLAACNLLVPDMKGNFTKMGYIGEVQLSINGAASYNITSFMIGNESYDTGDILPIVSRHPFLPQFNISFDLQIEDDPLDRDIEMTVHFDEKWNDLENGTEPEISPQSVLSLSRAETDGSKQLTWTIEGEESSIPDGVSIKILNITPVVQEAGMNATVTLDIPKELGTPQSLHIYSYVYWIRETTQIPTENISTGIASYNFFTPLLEGESEVLVNLTTDKGSFEANSTMILYPRIYLMAMTPSFEDQHKFDVHVGVDGSINETTVFYGISRSLGIGWDEGGWTMEPTGLIALDYGPFTFDLDLSDIGGSVYLRVCNYPGTVETYHKLELSNDIQIIRPAARIENDTLVIGPSIIFAKWDGLMELNPGDFAISYEVEIRNTRTDESFSHSLEWRSLEQLSEIDRMELYRISAEKGLTQGQITGCWIGITEVPKVEGNYTLRVHVIGDRKEHLDFKPDGFDYQLGFRESFSIGNENGDEKDHRELLIGIVIVIVVIITAIFILYVLEKGTKIKDQPALEEAPEPPREEETKEE